VIEIKPSQVTPALGALFDPNMPTALRCFAVLGGGNAGRIVTDDVGSPRWAYVWEADDGTLYRGGVQHAELLLDVVTTLRHDGLVALGFRDGDPSLSLFPRDPNAGASCLELDRPIGGSDLSPYLGRLPTGYEIYCMDREMLEVSPHREGTIGRWGSIEGFLATGIAVSLMHGRATVCEAYADMDVSGVRELGVTTQKAYRGQGFATITCAHLIALCEKAGSSTYWDCAILNRASVALARRLGFRGEREYKLLAWFQTTA
jgi:GNAT superfamily N-acetyltransferase